ncbi:MAG: hypothetical protein GF315_05110 [candidate division Zixibacteria bacterium]|nr:hypothetical protein [candidate division Zixibacteria bacterium]
MSMNDELQRKLAGLYMISVMVILIGIVFSIILHWDYVIVAGNYLMGTMVNLSPGFPGLPVALLILLTPIITIVGYLVISRGEDKATFMYAVTIALYLIINALLVWI